MPPLKIFFFFVDMYCIESVLSIYYKFPQIMSLVPNGVACEVNGSDFTTTPKCANLFYTLNINTHYKYNTL